MRIDWLVPCRYAEAQADGTMNLSGAGIDTFWVDNDTLPAKLAFFVAGKLVGEPDELLGTRDLRIRLRRPGSNRADDLISGQIQVDHLPDTTELPPGVVFVIPVAWEANELGVHRVDFVFDRQRRAVVFRVAHQTSG